MPSAAQPRYVAIDVVKGIAIVWVLFIHSAALGMETPVFVYLVNHAVPVFLVLFGLNSELWWRRRAFPEALGAWFRGRARRILVPMWAMIPVWWALVLWFRPPDVTLSARLLVLHALGWMRSIGTGWFITLVIQLVVAFPLLHVAAARVGRAPLLAAGLASTLVLTGLALRLMGPLGYFGYIVLAPRFFVHVVFGMMLAPVVGRLGVRTAVASAVLVVVLVALQRGVPIGGLAAYAERLEDLPLTTLLLVAALPLARVPLLGGELEWLGQSSYGVYIGQLITHNAFVYAFGLPGLYQRLDLWLYTAILLAGGVGFVFLGEQLAALLALDRARWRAAPAPTRPMQ